MIHKPTTPKIYTPQDDSCVLSLDARDVRGSKIYDRSGKGNHGTITGAVLKSSNYGIPVLDFDGVDDYINVGSDVSLSINTIAIELVLKPLNIPVGYDRVIQKANADGHGFSVRLFNMRFLWQSRLYLADGAYNAESDADFVIGKLYHLICVYDGINLPRLYINAVLQTSNFSDGAGDGGTSVLNIGRRANQGLDFSKIQLCKLAISKELYIENEISQRFNQIRHQYGI